MLIDISMLFCSNNAIRAECSSSNLMYSFVIEGYVHTLLCQRRSYSTTRGGAPRTRAWTWKISSSTSASG